MAAVATTKPTAAGAAGGLARDGKVSDHFDLKPMFEQTNCLNEDSSRPHTNLFVDSPTAVVESDADEQLLLRINFTSAVKIAELRLDSPSEEEEKMPTSVKIFINTPDLGFDEAEDLLPTQEIELSPNSLTSDTAEKLNYVKFQYVSNLTLFFPDNNGGDTTMLSNLKVFGSPVVQCDMSQFKKQGCEWQSLFVVYRPLLFARTCASYPRLY